MQLQIRVAQSNSFCRIGPNANEVVWISCFSSEIPPEVAADRQHFDVNFDYKEYSALAASGLIPQRRSPVNPACTEIRVPIRDSGSGALGSVTIPTQAFLPVAGAALPGPQSR